MTEVKIQTQSHHLATKASFTFFQDKLITIGEDCIMNVYDAKTTKNLQKIDLNDEFYAIASNSIDKIAIGGEQNKVDLHSIGSSDLNAKALEEPFLAMQFGTPVQRIQWVGKYVIGYSEDQHVQLFNSETEKVLHFKPGHEGSVKNGSMDPLGEYLATSGCDGHVIIYKIPQNEDETVEMVKKIKITKQNIETFGKNPFEISWAPDGSFLLATGEPTLAFIQRGTWDLSHSTEFAHKKTTTCLTWINDNVFATAGLDNVIKIWNYETKQLQHYITSANEVLQITYCQKNKCFAYIDLESNLGIWLKEFAQPIVHAADDADMKESQQELNKKEQEFQNISLEEGQDLDEEIPDNIFSQEKEEVKSEQAMSVTNHQIKSQASAVSKQPEENGKVVNPKQARAGKSLNDEPKSSAVNVKSKADEIIDMYPQQTFIPNCQFEFGIGKHKVLSWNMVGTICLRSEFQFTSIDVDFTNKQLHRNIVINDDFGATMATLNYSGMLLASKGQESDLDNYEDDEEDDMEIDGAVDDKKRKKYSHLFYKPFNTYKQSKDWHFPLKYGEQVECLAQGTGWCAASTDFNYIRVFSTEGIQKTIISQGTPVVTMIGYENLLGIVYHAGPSIYGCQALKLKIIDLHNKSYSIINDIECPISRYSNLIWIGFSEEGQIFTYDNEGIVRALNYSNLQWTPVIDFKLTYPNAYSQLWIVGVCESEILAIELPKSYAVPHLNQKAMIRRFKMKLPFLELEKKNPDAKEMTNPQIDEAIAREQLVMDHETYRKENWEHFKQFRSKYDNEFILSDTILTNNDIANKKKEMDKLILNAIRMSILSDDHEKVFSYMDMLHFSQSLKLCINLCEQLNVPELSQKIKKFVEDKEQKDLMQETHKSTKAIADRATLENRKLFKAAIKSNNEQPELSQFAINGSYMTAMQAKAQQQQQIQTTTSSSSNIVDNIDMIKTSSNTTVAEKPKVQIQQTAVNPFAKKQGAVDLGKKVHQVGTDIFKDLSDVSKPPQIGIKRQNPYGTDNKNPSKQKKLK